MTFQVLLSCMHADGAEMIRRSGLQDVPTLVINQSEVSQQSTVTSGIHTLIESPMRGLSVSRNLAIDNAQADVCLLCDDDEVFRRGLEKTVLDAYETYPDADLIIFKMENRPTKLGSRPKKLGKYELLRVSSWQISFKLSAVKGKIRFDTKLGAGTGNGAGEENKFLLDCYKNGLRIYYVPVPIASVAQAQSTWFSGFDKRFFFDRGKTTRYMLGLPTACCYGLHYLLTKYKLYKNDTSPLQAANALLRGIFAKDIDTPYD